MKAAIATVLAFGLAAGAARADNCKMLTAADVLKVTGVQVSGVDFNSKPGAGGKCANFVDGKGKLFLGVTGLDSAADYRNSVAAVPKAVYPQRTRIRGVGDEAILMSGGGSIRYFLARKGNHGVILFPFGPKPDDAQLKTLATMALH